MVLVLYTYELGKTAKKTIVMSISPWIRRQTAVTSTRRELAVYAALFFNVSRRWVELSSKTEVLSRSENDKK